MVLLNLTINEYEFFFTLLLVLTKRICSSAGYMGRVETVLDWLSLPQGDRPDFVTLYFNEPDHAGHGAGPMSGEVNISLQMYELF